MHNYCSCLPKQERQLSKEEIRSSKAVHNLRVHVEPAIRMVKEFHLFHGIIPLTMAGSINQLWTVASLLTNFQGPLFYEHKEWCAFALSGHNFLLLLSRKTLRQQYNDNYLSSSTQVQSNVHLHDRLWYCKHMYNPPLLYKDGKEICIAKDECTKRKRSRSTILPLESNVVFLDSNAKPTDAEMQFITHRGFQTKLHCKTQNRSAGIGKR